MRLRQLAALAPALVLAACAADEPVSPLDGPQFSVTGGSSANYVVMFKRQRGVPLDFGAQVTALGGRVGHALPQIGVASVAGLSRGAVASLQRRKDVSYVLPDETLRLDLPEAIAIESALELSAPQAPQAAAAFPRQWNMRAVQADAAWAAGHLGSSDVTVAILDTGIDYLHFDLAGRVDLARSTSFVPSDDALVASFFPTRHPVTDLHWHGTHVAATVSSNAFLMAGVTSHTTLIGVKVCGVDGSCAVSAVLAGIIFASDAGADIINLSLGALLQKKANPGFVSIINRINNFARRSGALIVVAAGNESADLDREIVPIGDLETPTRFPSLYALYCDGATVVCVSATGPATAGGTNGPWTGVDTRAEYSNFGRSAIDVAAPGGRGSLTGSGGLVWGICSTSSLVIPQCQTAIGVIGSAGTSMASPHASGVAALLVARIGTDKPSQVRTALQRTADDLGDPGTDPFFGKGRVNAARAAGAIH